MTYNTIQDLFTGICDSIRAKTGETDLINHQDIPAKIDAITTGDMKIGFFKGTYSTVEIGSDDDVRHIQLSVTNVDSTYDWAYVFIPMDTFTVEDELDCWNFCTIHG
jgi:hypothetical protein